MVILTAVRFKQKIYYLLWEVNISEILIHFFDLLSSDTFITNVSISVKSLNFSKPRNLSCIITTNTNVNTTKLDNIVKVIWYQYNETRNTVPHFSNNYRVHSTTSIGTVMFESIVRFKEVRASMAGQYTCSAWIEEEIYRNMSNSSDVIVKCKYKTCVFIHY